MGIQNARKKGKNLLGRSPIPKLTGFELEQVRRDRGSSRHVLHGQFGEGCGK
jgi:hypothetical protein